MINSKEQIIKTSDRNNVGCDQIIYIEKEVNNTFPITIYNSDSSPSTAYEALMQRETLGATGVGNGVAIPHARLAGIEKVVGAFFKLDKPMDFSSVDRKPVDLIFALFAPENAGVEHLKALALVSRTLRDDSMCSKLRANSNSTTMYAILTEKMEYKAA